MAAEHPHFLMSSRESRAASLSRVRWNLRRSFAMARCTRLRFLSKKHCRAAFVLKPERSEASDAVFPSHSMRMSIRRRTRRPSPMPFSTATARGLSNLSELQFHSLRRGLPRLQRRVLPDASIRITSRSAKSSAAPTLRMRRWCCVSRARRARLHCTRGIHTLTRWIGTLTRLRN